MKILFVPDNFPPEVNALASRTFEHCSRWVVSGEDVTVITCAPNFPQGKIYPGYRNKPYQTEEMAGIKVVRVWSYMAPNAGVVKRVLDHLSFTVTSFLAGLFRRADVMIGSTPQLMPVLAVCALSIIRRRPWVFEVRDLLTDSITAVGVMKRNLLVRALELLEKALYRHATRIVVVSPAFKDHLVRLGVDPGKIDIVTNGVDRAVFRPVERDETLARELGLTDKFVFAYVGTHGMAHGLDFILRSVAKIVDPRVHFLFIGDGAQKRELMDLARKLQLTNVTLLDPIPRTMVERYLSLADISLVPLRKTKTFTTVIPSKIFEAAAMRRPILLGVDGQARQIVESYEAGIFFEPEDEASFLSVVGRLADDASFVQSLKAGCDALAHAYDRNELAAKMLRILEAVAAGPRGGLRVP